MISAWWLLLVCPACFYMGMLVSGLCAASAQAELLAKLQDLRTKLQALSARLNRVQP